MKVLSNLFGNNSKINASEIAIKDINNKGILLKDYFDRINEYSTDEVKIGKWIDGKDVYRKVTVFSSIKNANNNDLEIGNIETVIDSNVHLLSSKDQDDSWRKIPSIYVLNDSYGDVKWAGGYFIRKNGTINFQFGTILEDIQTCIVILTYTKPTN